MVLGLAAVPCALAIAWVAQHPLVFIGGVFPPDPATGFDGRLLGDLQSPPTLFHIWHFAYVLAVPMGAHVLARDRQQMRRLGLLDPDFNCTLLMRMLAGVALSILGMAVVT